MTRNPFILFDDARDGRSSLIVRDLAKAFVARRRDEVAQVLDGACDAVARGYVVAGYMGYEAGLALDPKLSGLIDLPGEAPLVWFGAFNRFERIANPMTWLPSSVPVGSCAIDWNYQTYREAFDQVIAYIERGDVYQINLTMPARVEAARAPLAHFAFLRQRQAAGWGGVIFDGERWLLSCSPELFFALRGREVQCKPMKGTAPRGADQGSDRRNAIWLANSHKDRAENLMIVDLLRNDLSKVCLPRSVTVPRLWSVEPYPTLFQMTSTVRGTLCGNADARALLSALFPCGSITGTPKMRAIEIIAELERRARGPYTGAMGVLTPEGDAVFSILIRTLRIERDARVTRTDVGSGVVSDSAAESEWRECLTKMRYLGQAGL